MSGERLVSLEPAGDGMVRATWEEETLGIARVHAIGWAQVKSVELCSVARTRMELISVEEAAALREEVALANFYRGPLGEPYRV